MNTYYRRINSYLFVSAKDCVSIKNNTDSTHDDNDSYVTPNNYYYQIQVPPFFHSSSNESPIHKQAYPSLLHSIYVQPSFLTIQEATHCLSLVHSHAKATQAFQKGKNTERHVNYATVDFPIQDCYDLNHYLMNTLSLKDKLFHLYQQRYNISMIDLDIDDLFIVHYQAKEKDHTKDDHDHTMIMDRLEAHRDGTLLSFTIPLTSANTFQGGGTFFEALRYVQPTPEYSHFFLPGGVVRVEHAGDLIIHCGKLLHGGEVVTQGQRTVLVGFVHVMNDKRIRKGVLTTACKHWGRMDIARIYGQRWSPKFIQRQDEITSSSSSSSSTSSTKAIQTCTSCFQPGNIPELLLRKVAKSFLKRSDDHYQRHQRLVAEDILLRDILLLSPSSRGSRRRRRRLSSSVSLASSHRMNHKGVMEKEMEVGKMNETSKRAMLDDFTIL